VASRLLPSHFRVSHGDASMCGVGLLAVTDPCHLGRYRRVSADPPFSMRASK